MDTFDPTMRSQLPLESPDVQKEDISQIFAVKIMFDIPLNFFLGTNDFNFFDVESFPRYQEEVESAESVEESDKKDKSVSNVFDLKFPFALNFFRLYLSIFSLE